MHHKPAGDTVRYPMPERGRYGEIYIFAPWSPTQWVMIPAIHAQTEEDAMAYINQCFGYSKSRMQHLTSFAKAFFEAEQTPVRSSKHQRMTAAMANTLKEEIEDGIERIIAAENGKQKTITTRILQQHLKQNGITASRQQIARVLRAIRTERPDAFIPVSTHKHAVVILVWRGVV